MTRKFTGFLDQNYRAGFYGRPMMTQWLEHDEEDIIARDNVKREQYELLPARVLWNVVCEPAVRVFVAHSAPSTIAIVLWAFTIDLMHKRLQRVVTMHDLCDTFVNGVPTQLTIHTTAMQQKVNPFNPKSDDLLGDRDQWDYALEHGYFNLQE